MVKEIEKESAKPNHLNKVIKKGTFQRPPPGPPQRVLPFCSFEHMVGERATELNYVPKFNHGVYLQNKTLVGTVQQIFGKVEEYYFSVNLQEGFGKKSFKKGDILHLGTESALPIVRFTNPQKSRGGPPGAGRGGRGGPRGGPRGGFRGGARGGPRGGPRGGGFRGAPRGGRGNFRGN